MDEKTPKQPKTPDRSRFKAELGIPDIELRHTTWKAINRSEY
jgi:hypothetical protein